MDTPLMKCGHAANGKDGAGNPVCVICAVGPNDKDARTIDDSPPSLEGRRARCIYYGRSDIVKLKRECYFGCNYDCNKTIEEGGRRCKCEQPSNTNLPFFKHKPNEPFDKFYCGCWGWD